MKQYLVTVILYVCCVFPTHAVDLMDIYEQALENDPDFKSAYDVYLSNKENIPISRSQLYPQINLSANLGRTAQNIVVSPAVVSKGTFNNYQWTLTASQAVFNMQAWNAVAQAKASVKAAQAQFNSAAQDLMLRTSRAYFDVLLAKDTLSFAGAKKRANKRQLDQAEQRFRVGLDAITSVYEAKAAYDQSIAEVIQARNNQINQRENLRRLTNHTYSKLAPLRNSRIPLVVPEPNNENEWVDTGLRQNFLLHAAKYNFESAKENIRVQNAGHFPTFAIQTTTQVGHNLAAGNNFFAPQRPTTSNVQLAMNFPMFQGGLVEANVRQAKYDYQSTGEKLEKTYRDVVVNSRIAFNNITDGISKVKADRETVISQNQSLESTEAQFQVGTRTMVDVVNAQQRLFNAQRELANDQYDLIYSQLNLKFLAGTLNANDIELVNYWLQTTRISDFAPSNAIKSNSK